MRQRGRPSRISVSGHVLWLRAQGLVARARPHDCDRKTEISQRADARAVPTAGRGYDGTLDSMIQRVCVFITAGLWSSVRGGGECACALTTGGLIQVGM